MNRNQKIALGCGGAGCLGLIVVAVASVLVYLFMGVATSSNANRRYEVNTNSNRESISNSNNSSASDNDNNSNDQSASSSSDSGSSMSNDAKHRLFQAAGMVGDAAVVTRVLKKIGLMNDDGTPTSEYAGFMKDHFAWALRNTEFIQSVNTKEKAQEYVDEHISD